MRARDKVEDGRRQAILSETRRILSDRRARDPFEQAYEDHRRLIRPTFHRLMKRNTYL